MRDGGKRLERCKVDCTHTQTRTRTRYQTTFRNCLSMKTMKATNRTRLVLKKKNSSSMWGCVCVCQTLCNGAHYWLCIFNISGSGPPIALYLIFNMSRFDRGPGSTNYQTYDLSRQPRNKLQIQQLCQYDNNSHSKPVTRSPLLTRGKQMPNVNPICPSVHKVGLCF